MRCDARKQPRTNAKARRRTAGGLCSTAGFLAWHDVTKWGVEGRAWAGQERRNWFDRLPASAEETVTPAVWGLGADTAGMMVRFETDATSIAVDYELRSDRLALPHMPASGASGVDVYARNRSGKWMWAAAAKPMKKRVKLEVIGGVAPGRREYAIYFPLYNGVNSFKIGVPRGTAFEGLPPRPHPIVFYGTSITQGACASRPGMAETAILGRRLDRSVVNLGFSGNGRMDKAIGVLLGQIDAAMYVIDCLPNMHAAEIAEKCAPFVRQLRAARPTTPIVLVEDAIPSDMWIKPSLAERNADKHSALQSAFETLQKEGVGNLHCAPRANLLGWEIDGTVDGIHPSDLGLACQSDALEPILRMALRPSPPATIPPPSASLRRGDATRRQEAFRKTK